MATATGSHRQYRWLREAISGGSHAYEYSVLEIAADGQRCEHHGDVRFDRLALAVENRPGTQVALTACLLSSCGPGLRFWVDEPTERRLRRPVGDDRAPGVCSARLVETASAG